MIKIGDRVRILATRNDFLKESIGMIGTVVEINNSDEDCLVELPVESSEIYDRQWFYYWKNLEVVK